MSLLKAIPATGIVRAQIPGGPELRLFADGDPVATALFWGGLAAYEYVTIQLFLKLVKHSQVVFDIGANTGLFALLAAMGDPQRRVVAFEPSPEVFPKLKANIELNHAHNCLIEKSAVTDREGSITFYMRPGALLEGSTLKGFREGAQGVSVEAVTLDSYVLRRRIPKVDLLKIDTEATEPSVLEGASCTLRRDAPVIICEVLYGRTEKELHRLLDGTGYEYFWITDRGLIRKDRIEGDPTYKFQNYLFVHESKQEQIENFGF